MTIDTIDSDPQTSDGRRTFSRLAIAVALSVAALQACGGSSPTPPTTPTPPVTQPPPATTYSIAGQVVETLTRAPIAGARVESGAINATTDTNGRFTLSSTTQPPGTVGLTVSASGHRTRETNLTYPRAGEPVIDLTSTSAPFSEDFYNQLARNTYEAPGERTQLWRLSAAPRLYLKTTDETGKLVPPEVITVVTGALTDAVRLYSAGTFSAAIEQGTGTRPEEAGWINVEIRQTIPQGDYCGLATIGASPGWIQLRLERCGCGSVKVPAAVVLHEVGHALGFFHVSDRNSVMFPFNSGECRQQTLSALELTHVAVAYARPRANRDPDRDPANFAFFNPFQATPGWGGGPLPLKLPN